MSNLTSAQQWMVNAGAILADINGMPNDELHAFDPYDHTQVDSVTRMLSQDWGIGNREHLITMVDGLISGERGHNISFLDARDYWARFSLSQSAEAMRRYDDDAKSDISLVLNHAHTIGPAGILSWDLGRCVPMLRNGHSLGWINEQETWEKLSVISLKMQQNYQSWQHAGIAYVVGRLFWAKGGLSESTCNAYFSRFKKIIVNPEHPWNTLDWNTKLV